MDAIQIRLTVANGSRRAARPVSPCKMIGSQACWQGDDRGDASDHAHSERGRDPDEPVRSKEQFLAPGHHEGVVVAEPQPMGTTSPRLPADVISRLKLQAKARHVHYTSYMRSIPQRAARADFRRR